MSPSQLQGWNKATTRASLPAIAVPGAIATVVARYHASDYTELHAHLLAASLPVMLLGWGLGTFVAANVNEAQFSQYAQFVVAVMAVRVLSL